MDSPTRYAALLEYDGSKFCGWQRQDGPGVATVQGAVERAIGKVADENITVTVAGRTDTGVHACAQAVHFETRARRELRSWFRGVNSELPDSVSLLHITAVDAGFHARFSALARWYRYIILNRETPPTYLRRKVTWHRRALSVDAMAEAARCFVGRHDFSALRAAACQARSPLRTVHRLEVNRSGPWLWLDVEADGFLHHMVRNLAGTLLAVGGGEHEPAWAAQVLASGDRTLAGATAPPDGLYLARVTYPPQYKVDAPLNVCRFW